jgi:DNA mismatch repair protein MutS
MMNFYSILFEKSKAGQVKLSSEAPACFGDLNLDQIVDTVTAGRDEYELKPFFISF